jgi:uncharacterized phage protein gp47/JayE
VKPIPTITEINANISGDFKSKFNLVSDFLKKTFNALMLVLSGQFYLVYLYLRDIQDNIFPDTATSITQGGTLERLGNIYLNRNPFPASIGVFNLSVTGVAGSILRSQLTFKSNEDALNQGQIYVLDAEYTLTGVDDIIEVRSIGAGVDFNLAVGNNLTITEPIIGVNKTVTVTEVIEQPKAGESLDLYRQAILNAIQLEPQGGSRGDYRQWCTDAQGVRLIYPYVRDADSPIVDIFVEATKVDSTDGKGTPSSTILDDVLEVINEDPDTTKPAYERSRKPMQADVIVSPIVLVPIDVTIIGLDINTPAIRDSIQSGIETFLYDVRPFIAGADLRRNKNDILYSGKLQSVVTEGLVNGNYFTNLELFVDGNLSVFYEFTLGNIPYLRDLTINGTLV